MAQQRLMAQTLALRDWLGGDQAIPVPIAPAGSNFLSDGKIQRQITGVP